MGIYRQLWNPLNAKDFEGALKVVDAVLLRNYAEPNAHMVASIAHAQLGRQMESRSTGSLPTACCDRSCRRATARPRRPPTG